MGVKIDLENYFVVETKTEDEFNADLQMQQMDYLTQIEHNTPALGACAVCQLGIYPSDELLRCPNCKTLTHRDHFLEWIKIKGFCPDCITPLKLVDFLRYESVE